MRYVVIIVDGSGVAGAGADLYAALEASETPVLDAMGRFGKVGAVATGGVPGAGGFAAGALSLLGYPAGVAGGVTDAVIEASAFGGALLFGDSVARVGLVRVSPDDRDGLLIGDASPSGGDRGGAAGGDELRALFDDLVAHWAQHDGLGGRMSGVSFVGEGADRLMIVRGGGGLPEDPFRVVEMFAPSAVEGRRWVEHLPDGGDSAGFLCELISASRHFLAGHPVNTARDEQGLGPINLAWVWDGGAVPDLAVSGLGRQAGSAAVYVDGAGSGAGSGAGTGSGLELMGRGLAGLLGVGHAELSGEALASGVVASEAEVAVVLTGRPIGEADASVIGPIVDGLAGERAESVESVDGAPWRVLVAVSHDPGGPGSLGEGLTPFVLAGGRVRSVVDRRLSGALASDLRVEPASDLLEYVLRSGLRGE